MAARAPAEAKEEAAVAMAPEATLAAAMVVVIRVMAAMAAVVTV